MRVVLIDGLSRADSPRLPTLEAVCRAGADLVVDVGFPTRSLAVQEVLWTGLTAQQLGSPYDNDARPPHPASMPGRVPDAIAVVEAYRGIAASVGFATVLPPGAADGADPAREPAAIAAWRPTGFRDAATRAVASTSRLVLVHVLAVDEAAHRHGRRGRAYEAALLSADRTLASVRAALPAGARLVVVADHGHLDRGGHGDAEDEVRRVRACLAPGAGVRAGAEIHLVDLSRAIASDLGLSLAREARGRPLAIAAASPAPDATLPRSSVLRWAAAWIALALGLGACVAASGPAALWPALSIAAWWAVRGAPSLSDRPALDLALAAAAAPLLLALVTAATPRRLVGRCLAPVATAVAATAVIGLPSFVMGGPPPRIPYWNGVLALIALLAIAALASGAFAGGVRWASALRRPSEPD